jgi:hypothetical protein
MPTVGLAQIIALGENMLLLIAMTSIIPGLGFLIMGRWKSALLTWLSLIPFVSLLLLTFWIKSLKCLLLCGAWILLIIIIQWVRAFRLAKILDQLNRDELTLLNEVDSRNIQFNPHWTHSQRQHIILGKRLETHLLPGENLQEWVIGEKNFRKSFWGDRIFCIGLIPNYLLIAEFGIFDYPETIRRVPRTNAKIFSGSHANSNFLWIVEQNDGMNNKSIGLTLSNGYTELLKRFNEQAHSQPMFKR